MVLRGSFFFLFCVGESFVLYMGELLVLRNLTLDPPK